MSSVRVSYWTSNTTNNSLASSIFSWLNFSDRQIRRMRKLGTFWWKIQQRSSGDSTNIKLVENYSYSRMENLVLPAVRGSEIIGSALDQHCFLVSPPFAGSWTGFGFQVSVSYRIRKSIQVNSKDVGIPTPFQLRVAYLMKIGNGQDESNSRATPTWRIGFGCWHLNTIL